MDYQSLKMPIRGNSRCNNKRSMDGDSNPASECQSDHSDLLNNFDFAMQPDSSQKQENVSRDTRQSNDSEEQSFLRQVSHQNQSNDSNNNCGYHVVNSSPSGTYKKIPKTPKTYPRTIITSKTPMAQRVALQSLRQHMSFTNGDDVSYDKQSPDFERETIIAPQQNGAVAAELPDSNQMVLKLVQLRDDINQVTTMIDSLEANYPSSQVQEQLNRLVKVRHQMQSSESQLKTLYHKMTLALREETVGAVDGREKHESSFSAYSKDVTDSHTNKETKAKQILNEAVAVQELQAAFRDKEAIQQKLIVSQEKLKSIKKKQAASDEALAMQLMAIKKQQQQKITSNGLPVKLDTAAATHATAENSQLTLPAYLLRATQPEGDRDNMIPERLNDNTSGRATQLSDDAVIKDFGPVVDATSQVASAPSTLNQPSNDVHDQREKLEFKLKDLMDKKLQMDTLLSELTKLKEQQNICQAAAAVNSQLNDSGTDKRFEQKVNNTLSCNSSQHSTNDAAANVHDAIANAQKLLQSISAQEKYKELHTMKERLSQLKRMVSSYELQNGNAEISEDIEKQTDNDSIRNMMSDMPSDARKHSNISKDSLALRGRRDWSPEGHCSADEEEDEEDQSVSNALMAEIDDTEEWTDNAVIQEKMRKLQEAKSKLSRLQDLINVVQEAKDGGIPATLQCRQLLQAIETVDDEVANVNDFPNIANATFEGNDVDANLTNAAQALNEESNRVAEECSTKMKAQKDILDNLMEERKMLLDVQEQLLNLQKQVPLNNNKQTSSHKDSNTCQSSRAESLTNFRFHPNFQSNSEPRDMNLPRQLNSRNKTKVLANEAQSSSILALREELQRQNDVLKELMREEKEKQQTFLQNQDNQSVQSIKSMEQYGKTYRAGVSDSIVHIGGATWSGSTTQDNFDDEVDDQNYDESQEEPDVYSEEEPICPQVETSRPDMRFVSPRICNSNAIQSVGSVIMDRNSSGNIWDRGNSLSQNEMSQERIRQENIRPVEDFVNDQNERNAPLSAPTTSAGPINQNLANSLSQPSAHLLQRIEENINLCQTILRDQHALSAIIQSSHNTGFPPMLSLDQQTRYNFHQCYSMMYQQQMDIQLMQQQLNQLLRGQSAEVPSSNSTANQQNLIDESHFSTSVNNSFQPNPPIIIPPSSIPTLLNTVPPLLQSNPSSMFGSLINNHHIGNSVGMTRHPVGDTPKTLNNQVAPGTRANNYWDNFRSCSRQNLLSVHKSNQQPGYQTVPSCLLTTQFLPSQQHPSSMAPIQMDDNLSNARNDSVQHMPFDSATRMPNSDQAAGENLLNISLKKHKTNKEQKPDVKNICNENRFFPNARQIIDQNIDNITQPFRPNIQRKPLDPLNVEQTTVPRIEPQANAREKLRLEPDSTYLQNGNFLEQVYSEAASLISENESRPMYLMELFRELKLINSDDYRQNALCSLHDLSSKFIQANSENFVNKSQRNFRNETDANSSNGSSTKLFNKEDSQKSIANRHSRSVGGDSKISRKKQNSNQSCATVSDQAVSRVSDGSGSLSYNQPSAKDQTSGVKPPIVTQQVALETSARDDRKSTGAIKKRRMCPSSNASDEQAASNSEMTPAQIEVKVQNIILKLLPFIRVNLDESCQPKILNSICKLVITLTRETCVECNAADPPEFLQHELKRILQDVTFKFNGQRLKDCVQDLLSNISEVVYNDLAYILLIKHMKRPFSSPISTDVKSVIQSLSSESHQLDEEFKHTTSEIAEISKAVSETQDFFQSLPRNEKQSTVKLPPPIVSTTAIESKLIAIPQNLAADNSDLKSSLNEASYSGDSAVVAQNQHTEAFDHSPVLAEAETEPEADINNKDLAEADQSPQPSNHHHSIVVQMDGNGALDGQLIENDDSIIDAAEDDICAAASVGNLETNALQNQASIEHQLQSSCIEEASSTCEPIFISTEDDQDAIGKKESGDTSE